MKSLLYLLSGLLVAPGALLALYIWTITEVIKEGVRIDNLWKALWHLFVRALQVMDWAFWLVPLLLVLWLALAFMPKYRLCGALVTSVVALASLVEMLAVSGSLQADALFIPALSLAGLLLSLWLAWNSVDGFVLKK